MRVLSILNLLIVMRTAMGTGAYRFDFSTAFLHAAPNPSDTPILVRPPGGVTRGRKYS